MDNISIAFDYFRQMMPIRNRGRLLMLTMAEQYVRRALETPNNSSWSDTHGVDPGAKKTKHGEKAQQTDKIRETIASAEFSLMLRDKGLQARDVDMIIPYYVIEQTAAKEGLSDGAHKYLAKIDKRRTDERQYRTLCDDAKRYNRSPLMVVNDIDTERIWYRRLLIHAPDTRTKWHLITTHNDFITFLRLDPHPQSVVNPTFDID